MFKNKTKKQKEEEKEALKDYFIFLNSEHLVIYLSSQIKTSTHPPPIITVTLTFSQKAENKENNTKVS